MTSGIDRFDRGGSKSTVALEALDVVADDGDLRRRDSWRTVQRASPMALPGGLAVVKCRTVSQVNAGGPYSNSSTHRLTVNGLAEILVGCDEPFDCILWPEITRTATGAGNNLSLRLSYSTDGEGSATVPGTGDPNDPATENLPLIAWTSIPWFRDTTRWRYQATTYAEPLRRAGVISWHREQLDGWTRCAHPDADVRGLYWIRLLLQDPVTGDPATLAEATVMKRPGLRAGLLYPVNGLLPLRLRGGASALLVGSDRRGRARGREAGAMMSATRGGGQDAQPCELLIDSGAGVFDVFTWPAAEKDDASLATIVNAAAATRGTAGVLTKNDDYEWEAGPTGEPDVSQWRGAPVLTDLAPDAGPPAPSTTTVLMSGQTWPDNLYEGLRLRCTDKSIFPPTGTPLGEETEIVMSGTSGWLMFWPALSVAPDAANRFAIIGRHARIGVLGQDETYEAQANAAQTVTPTTSKDHETSPAGGLTGRNLFFEMLHELRWKVRAGMRWSGIVDPVSSKVIVTNGESGLLEWNGRHLLPLAADTTSENARLLTAAVPDESPNNTIPSQVAKALLRLHPPPGRYVVAFQGRIVTANMPGRPRDVAWTAPGAGNGVWPLNYQAGIFDDDHQPITGLATLGDRLVAFTPSTIHEAIQSTGGILGFRPVATGMGFTAHAAVAQVAIQSGVALIGPTPNGVAMWNGAEPVPVVDRWDRIVPGGVNATALHLAVGAAWGARRMYFVAVPRAGQTTLDRIVVYDYARKRTWLWSCPWGVSSMAIDRDARGRERLLVGTDDGHVLTMIPGATDDGETIDAYALTPPLAPFGDLRADFQRVVVELGALGPNQSVTVETRVNQRDEAAQEAVADPVSLGTYLADRDAPTASDPEFGDRSAPAATDPVLAGHESGVETLNLRIGTAGHVFQAKVSGSATWSLRGATVEARALERGGR